MCGIFGLVQAQPIEFHQLVEMSRLLRHRGPDDEGFLTWDGDTVQTLAGVDTPQDVLTSAFPYAPKARIVNERRGGPGLALGHRRLSILDLSPAGHQPMSHRDRLWLVYNGEVYNYVELRRELVVRGYPFLTETDTEVILAAYDVWGVDAFSRFNGMWAMAILDTRRKTLLLSRDRFGVKPLYYTANDTGVAFASEIKALSARPQSLTKANNPRLLDFLIWNVLDHNGETMFDGVQQIPPGHFASIDVGPAVAGRDTHAWSVSPIRWYSLPTAPAVPGRDAAAAVGEALQDAVRLRLRADVPVGSCLSGGLDSSAIVCLMGRVLTETGSIGQLKTFTADSKDAAFDESRYARQVIQATGADGHFVTPNPDQLFEDLDRLIWHQDEPFGSSSIFAQWEVFHAARTNGVVVMLDGQGADEILGGYRGYFGAFLGGLFAVGRGPTYFRELVAIHRSTGFGYPRLFGYTLAYANPGMLRFLGRFDRRAFSDKGWISAGHHDAYDRDPFVAGAGRPTSVREMSVSQLTATHLPMLLHWEDRNSMASSVEARVPFLDYRVVELCLGLSDDLKVGGGIAKAVLRNSMRGTVPDAILDRRDKMGFVTAEPLWMARDRAPQFRAALAESVETLSGMLDPRILRSFDEVVTGRKRFDFRYWRAITAGRWAKTFGVSTN